MLHPEQDEITSTVLRRPVVTREANYLGNWFDLIRSSAVFAEGNEHFWLVARHANVGREDPRIVDHRSAANGLAVDEQTHGGKLVVARWRRIVRTVSRGSATAGP